jgi:outer membrane protein insertion porin family
MVAAVARWRTAMIRISRAIAWEFALLALISAPSQSTAEPAGGKEIGEIVVQGNRIRPSAQILAMMELKPGQPYRDEIAQSDVGRLLAQAWFRPNGVQLFVNERPDERLTVIVRVIEFEKNIQRITFIGAEHLSKEERERLTDLKTGGSMSPAKNQQARLALMRAYHEKGRCWANVRLAKGGDESDDEIVFDIAEGPVVNVRNIKFEYYGPTSGDTNTFRLRTQIESSRSLLGLIGGDFNPIQLDMDIIKLTEYYRKMGYLYARIQRELIWSKDHRDVTIVFHIEEVKRYRVGRLQIGRTENEQMKLLAYVDLHAGDYYDKAVIQADIDRLRDYYGYRGRNVVVRDDVYATGDGVVNVHYRIEDKAAAGAGKNRSSRGASTPQPGQ